VGPSRRKGKDDQGDERGPQGMSRPFHIENYTGEENGSAKMFAVPRIYGSMRSIAAWILVGSLWGVPAPIDAHAGEEPDFLERFAATYRFRLGQPAAIRVAPDAGAVLFLRSGPRSFNRDLYEMELDGGRERLLVTATDLLGEDSAELSAAEKARRERMRLVALGISSYELSPDGSQILVPLSGRLFLVSRADLSNRELTGSAGYAIDAHFSPDGKMVSCVRDGEIFVLDLASGRERQLTRDAGEGVTHGLAEFVAQEEMRRYRGYWWSPDSTQIAYQRTDTRALEQFYIADAAHPDKPPNSWPYPRPGKVNADVQLGVIAIGGGETTWVDWDHDRYEYLAVVRWSADAPLTILVQNRRQTEERLLSVDTASGKTSTLLVERDAAWINLHHAMPYWLPGGDRFLWISERGGMPQLELRRRDGTRVRALHGADLGLRRFELYLADSDAVVVRAGGDPTKSQLFSVSVGRDAKIVPLSGEDNVDGVVSEGDGPLFVYRSAAADRMERYLVAGAAGALDTQLRSAAEPPELVPRLEFVEVGEQPKFHAVLVRPTSFDPEQRYPVIVHVYGGPGAQMVRRDAGSYLLDQWFADQGYIVVAIDGRGTPARGRDWERSTKGDLIELPLADQVTALRALGARYPELDLGRVGIHGWSFGGYFSAMAVLRRPDVFHVAVAGAPVVTWEDYDTHYTERYMDLPQRNPTGYASASVLTHADRLERPLLLIHGTADDNVYFMHSLRLADALLRSGKTFEFLPLPGFTHMVPDPEVSQRMYRRILAMFDEHLGQH
jgi:dipeptidyl-peptidase-4